MNIIESVTTKPFRINNGLLVDFEEPQYILIVVGLVVSHPKLFVFFNIDCPIPNIGYKRIISRIFFIKPKIDKIIITKLS